MKRLKKIIKEKPENISGCSLFLIVFLPFIFLLLTLNAVEPFLLGGIDDTPFHFTLFIALTFTSYVFLYLFFAVANIWQKWLMYIYMALIVLQTVVGYMYRYYRPNHDFISKAEEMAIEDYIENNTPLPNNIEVLSRNDSIWVFGRRSNVPAFRYASWNNPLIESNILKETITLTRESFLNKIKQPNDFYLYKELLVSKDMDSDDYIDYWTWQYPDWLLYIYIYKCESVYENGTKGPCNTQFYKLYINKRDRVQPIILELFKGQLDIRYRNYFDFLHEILFPKYVRTDLGNDPYFLIYQGKYKKAREGLKNLPPARREFCEKKLEKLGY